MARRTAIAVTVTPAQAAEVVRPMALGLLLLTVTLILLFGAAWTPAT